MKGFLADSGVIVVGETNGVDKLLCKNERSSSRKAGTSPTLSD
jgi:hypothetical protein